MVLSDPKHPGIRSRDEAANLCKSLPVAVLVLCSLLWQARGSKGNACGHLTVTKEPALRKGGDDNK